MAIKYASSHWKIASCALNLYALTFSSQSMPVANLYTRLYAQWQCLLHLQCSWQEQVVNVSKEPRTMYHKWRNQKVFGGGGGGRRKLGSVSRMGQIYRVARMQFVMQKLNMQWWHFTFKVTTVIIKCHKIFIILCDGGQGSLPTRVTSLCTSLRVTVAWQLMPEVGILGKLTTGWKNKHLRTYLSSVCVCVWRSQKYWLGGHQTQKY